MRWAHGLRSEAEHARDWLAPHDPGFWALRRALRTATLMPAAFAFTWRWSTTR